MGSVTKRLEPEARSTATSVNILAWANGFLIPSVNVDFLAAAASELYSYANRSIFPFLIVGNNRALFAITEIVDRLVSRETILPHLAR
jgi:hypothetical protein